MRKILLLIFLIFIFSYPCFGWGPSPLSVYYVGGAGSGESISENVEKVWDYSYSYHVLGANGDTMLGALDSKLQFEESELPTRKDPTKTEKVGQLTYLKIGLSGKTYSLSFGDNVTRFSELTLNNMSYQGIGLTLKPARNFIFTLVGGSKGNSYWGKEIRRDTRQENVFNGFRTTFYPAMNYGINATYLTLGRGKELFAYGGQYTLGNLGFFAEHGTAGDGTGFVGEVKYNNRVIKASSRFRDISKDYENPVDYMTFAGKRGTYSKVAFFPFRNLTVSGQYDTYVDNSSKEVIDPDIINIDQVVDVSYNLTPTTMLYLSNWSNDRRAYPSGGLGEGSYASISQTFYLIGRNIVYAKVQPTSFKSFSTSEESYTDERNIVGINISPVNYITLNYESETGIRKITNTGVKTEPSATEIRLDLTETRIGYSPVFLSASTSNRVDVPDKDSKDEVTSIYSDLTLRIKPFKELSFYVSTSKSNVQTSSEDDSYKQTHFKYGLNYSFNTNVYLKAGNGHVEGYVFADKNGNGIKDEDEKGLVGVMVIAGNKIGITDRDGHYSIKRFKGKSAGIDFTTLPDGYICTTASNRSIVALEDNKVNFGLIKKNFSKFSLNPKDLLTSL